MSCVGTVVKVLIPCRCIPLSKGNQDRPSSHCFEVFAATLFGCLVTGAVACASSYGFYRLYKSANVAPWVRSLSQASMGVSAAVGAIAIAGYLLRGTCQGAAVAVKGTYHAKAAHIPPEARKQSAREQPSTGPSSYPPLKSIQNHQSLLDSATKSTAEDFFLKISNLFTSNATITEENIQQQQNALDAFKALIDDRSLERHIKYIGDCLALHQQYFDLKKEVDSVQLPTTCEQRQKLLKKSRALTYALGKIQSPAIPYGEYNLKTPEIYSRQTTEFFALSNQIARMATVEERYMQEILKVLEQKGSKISDVSGLGENARKSSRREVSSSSSSSSEESSSLIFTSDEEDSISSSSSDE